MLTYNVTTFKFTINSLLVLVTHQNIAQSARAVEYTDCREGKASSNECPGYDAKLFNGEVPVMLELWGIRSTLFIAITPRSTLALCPYAKLNC